MSRLEGRIKRLEGGRADNEVTVVAVVPRAWSELRREREVREAAIERGAVEPFKLWIIPSESVDGVCLQWIGGVRDMLGSIAREGRRVTDAGQRKSKRG